MISEKLKSLREVKNNIKIFFKIIFESWLFKNIILPGICIPILVLILFYFSQFFGFRIDGITLYGISVEKRPEINYFYEKEIDGFKLDWNPEETEFEQLSWILKIGKREYSIKTYSTEDPFVITSKEITRILYDYSLDKILEDLNKFSNDGNYSGGELKDGIECEVLPYLSKRGIPIAAKIRYQNERSNEVHETLDTILMKGLGGNAPRALVERNVSKEKWNRFLDEGGIIIEESLMLITKERKKYKNDLGECPERYILEYEIK